MPSDYKSLDAGKGSGCSRFEVHDRLSSVFRSEDCKIVSCPCAKNIQMCRMATGLFLKLGRFRPFMHIQKAV